MNIAVNHEAQHLMPETTEPSLQRWHQHYKDTQNTNPCYLWCKLDTWYL